MSDNEVPEPVNNPQEGDVNQVANDVTRAAQCRVCLDEIADDEAKWTFIPCGHAPFCTGCTDILMQGLPANRPNRARIRRCPVCRHDIHNKIRLYMQSFL